MNSHRRNKLQVWWLQQSHIMMVYQLEYDWLRIEGDHMYIPTYNNNVCLQLISDNGWINLFPYDHLLSKPGSECSIIEVYQHL